MGRPAHPSMMAAERGPKKKAQVDAIEITQAVQDLTESVPLVARKRTIVRVYLGIQTGALNVQGELRVSRHPHGPWISVPSMGTAQLDGSRHGTALADLHSRRDTLDYSLNFRLPPELTIQGAIWVQLHKLREVGSGHPVHIDDPIGTKSVTFAAGPPLRLQVLNLRYTTGTTVDATAAWPFTSGDANAQVAAIRALDMAGGGDPKTHYYGIFSDGGGFMRGSAAGIPGTPDPSTVASGPTGSNNWGWDNDGSYGDWYGGHELGHTFGRFHPGFCGESHDDPSYPFTAGQLANADDAFVGIDVGDSTLGITPSALPGTGWHDVMTYCPTEWLSSYTYEGIRDRLAAEAALFPGAVPAPALPGASRLPDEDETALIDAIIDIPDSTSSFDLLLDGNPIATFKVGEDPGPPAKNLELKTEQPAERGTSDTTETGQWTLSWQGAAGAKRGGPEDNRSCIVQASIDEGHTWTTLAVGSKRSDLDVDPADVADADHVRFRVLTTNGVSYSESSTDVLEQV